MASKMLQNTYAGDVILHLCMCYSGLHSAARLLYTYGVMLQAVCQSLHILLLRLLHKFTLHALGCTLTKACHSLCMLWQEGCFMFVEGQMGSRLKAGVTILSGLGIGLPGGSQFPHNPRL